MATFSDTKVGDRVWSIQWGWGEIAHTYPHDLQIHPIQVGFKYKSCKGEHWERFSLQGVLNAGKDENPTLFWDEVVVDPPAKPSSKKERPKKKEKCSYCGDSKYLKCDPHHVDLPCPVCEKCEACEFSKEIATRTWHANLYLVLDFLLNQHHSEGREKGLGRLTFPKIKT